MYSEWPGLRQELDTTTYSHVGEVEHQGCRVCGPWKVQLGGPSEDGEGRERTGEKSFIVSQKNATLYAFKSEQSTAT